MAKQDNNNEKATNKSPTTSNRPSTYNKKPKHFDPYEEMGAKHVFDENDDDETIRITGEISMAVNDCVNFRTSTLLDQWQTNIMHYNRTPLRGDDLIKGRSKYVSSDVQERVDWFTAQLVSTFESQQQIVSFKPNTRQPHDVKLAEQQNRVLNHVLREKDSHVGMLSPWIQNGAMYGLGVVHIEFDAIEKEGPPEWLKGVTDEDLVKLTEQQEEGKLKIIKQGEPYKAEIPPELMEQVTALAGQQGVDVNVLLEQGQQLLPTVRDLGIRRCSKLPYFKKTSLAVEDYVVSRDAELCPSTGGVRAQWQGHHAYATKEDLVEMGYDKDLVNGIAYAQQKTEGVAIERYAKTDFNAGRGFHYHQVNVYEIYTKMAIKKGGQKRHYRFTLAGDIYSSPVLLGYRETSEFYPYAAFVPYPQPNTLFGQGVADRVGKEQEITTRTERAVHDNMMQIVNPVKIVNPEVTNTDDLLNIHPGKIIRSSDPAGGISYTTPPFALQSALPFLEQLRQRQDNTTGVGAGMMSTVVNDMQNVTATGVKERVNASQLLIQHVCFHFANTAYRYLAKCTIDQMRSRPDLAEIYIARLADEYEPLLIDEWDADMDVATNVQFGLMDKDYQDQTLTSMLALQEKGVQMGFATPANLYQTAMQIAENRGIADQVQFTDPSQIPQPQPQPSEAQIIAESEKLKADLKFKADQAERDFEWNKLRVENDLKRDQMAQDLEIAKAEIAAKYAYEMDLRRLEFEQERERLDVEYARAQFEGMTERTREINNQKEAEMTRQAQEQAAIQAEQQAMQQAMEQQIKQQQMPVDPSQMPPMQ